MTDACDVALKGSIDDQAVSSDLLTRIQEEVEKLRRSDPTQPLGVHYATAAERVAAELKGAAADYEKQMLTQVKAINNMRSSFDTLQAGGFDPGKAFRTVIGAKGDAAIAEGERAMSRFLSDVESQGLLPAFHLLRKDRTMRLAFMTEIQQLNLKKGQPGVSKNPQAAKMAKIFQTHVDYYRAQMKDAGFKVADLEGRMLKQVWDSDRILQATPTAKEFADALISRVDRLGGSKVTDMSEADVRSFLESFHGEITGRTPQELDVSARNLILERSTYAVRQARSREIHFKTPEDALYVLENFGQGDVSALMTQTLRGLGKSATLNFEMGINPRAAMQTLIEHAVKRGGDRTSIQGGKGTLALTPEKIMRTIDGWWEDNAANPTIAEASDTLHNFARAAYLSMASITAVGDVATLNAANRRVGIERASTVAGAVVNILEGLPPEVRKEAGGIIEAASVHALGTIHRYTTLPGINHRLYNASIWTVDKVFTLNGLNMITRKNKQSAYIGYSARLAKFIQDKVPFEKLDPSQQRSLVRGSISKEDWNKIITSDRAVLKDGERLFLDVGAVDARTAAKLNAALAAFVNGEAVITPNVLTRTSMTLGTQRGTWEHALTTQMTFLLGYPIAYLSQGVGRQIEATGIASYGMLRLAAALTGLGVVTVMAQDAAKGRYRDYTNPEIMVQILNEGIVKGGAMTIIGEHLWKLAGADRHVHHLLFGDNAEYKIPENRPFTFGDILTGAGLEYATKVGAGAAGGVWDIVTGDVDEGMATLGKTAKGTLPFVNLPVVKPLVDTVVFDTFIEMFDPRSIEQAQRRWNQRTGGGQILDLFNE